MLYCSNHTLHTVAVYNYNYFNKTTDYISLVATE